MAVEGLGAEEIVTRSMKIAGDLCVYTNHRTVLEMLEKPAEKVVPTLGYWALRGKGAQIRHLLAYVGVEYENKEYEIVETEDGINRDAWLDVKFTLGLPFPNVPHFIDGDYKLTESKAIMKYIAKKHQPGLLGQSAEELGRIEMWAGVHTSVYDKLG